MPASEWALGLAQLDLFALAIVAILVPELWMALLELAPAFGDGMRLRMIRPGMLPASARTLALIAAVVVVADY